MILAALFVTGCSGAPAPTGSARDAAALDAPPLDAAAGFDAAPDLARTIPPAMPGVWRNLTPPTIDPSTTPCTDLQFDPSHRSTLYAMYGGAGIYKSTDAGATWAPIGNLPSPISLGRLLVDPRDSSHLYATGSVQGSSLGFWVSHDGGQTFAMPAAFSAGAGTRWNLDVYNLVADPTDFNHILMTFHSPWPCCGEAAGVLESKDGGGSYVAHDPATGMDHGQGIAFLYDPARGLGNADTWLVGAGYASGLFRTTDAGATWSLVSTLEEDHGGFDAHYSTQGFLYLGASDGVHRSTDNGQTWTAVSQGALVNWTYSVIGDGKYLYSSPAFVGQPFHQPIYVSPEGGPDEGTSWSALGSQVIPNGPWKMELDSINRIIYSANWSSGAWALTLAD